MTDAAAAISGPRERAARLIATRNLKMARSAHAYVRGSTVKFYDWLGSSSGKIPEGPPVWICGDCHMGNLGPLADAKGRVAVQIRDLDQTVIGNPAHDIVRLGLSLASAARGSDLSGVTTARILEQLVAAMRALWLEILMTERTRAIVLKLSKSSSRPRFDAAGASSPMSALKQSSRFFLWARDFGPLRPRNDRALAGY